jgi:hypothetical protein
MGPCSSPRTRRQPLSVLVIGGGPLTLRSVTPAAGARSRMKMLDAAGADSGTFEQLLRIGLLQATARHAVLTTGQDRFIVHWTEAAAETYRAWTRRCTSSPQNQKGQARLVTAPDGQPS